MPFNLAKEKEKNQKIIAAILLRADDLMNGVAKDVKRFLEQRGDQDAAQQAEKIKAEIGKVIDDYVAVVKKRPAS